MTSIQRIPIEGYENKEVIIFTRKHWASMIKTIGLIVLLLAIPLVLLIPIYYFSPIEISGIAVNFVAVLVIIYYFVMTTFAFVEWISYYYDIFIITEDIIIDISQQGIFDRRIAEVSIIRIQDVSARINGFFPTFFGYGNVVAESAGEKTQTYVIDCVPRPVAIANKILELHNKQISREEREHEVTSGEGDLRSHSQTPAKKEPEFVKEMPKSGDIDKEDLNDGGEIKF